MVDTFRSFLEGTCHISAKKVPFFLYWISKYHEFNKSSTQPDTERLKTFLVELARKYEEWQVKQAQRANSLYAYYTKNRLPSNSVFSSDWHSVKVEVVRLLRLRHNSQRTEKTYLGWLRRM